MQGDGPQLLSGIGAGTDRAGGRIAGAGKRPFFLERFVEYTNVLWGSSGP
jgi:hypothetical protein